MLSNPISSGPYQPRVEMKPDIRFLDVCPAACLLVCVFACVFACVSTCGVYCTRLYPTAYHAYRALAHCYFVRCDSSQFMSLCLVFLQELVG
jgi:hypothetical protein